MAEQETVKMVEDMVEETLEEAMEEIEEVATHPASEPAEKPGLLGQTPSMWFLIDSAVVLLIVIIMRVAA
ncbi:MAG: hypothetical protein KF753_02210 [Caldilineaceae bacterium]|nr:hypothetical protein [Caldilineaceae bacterium]